MSLFGNTFGRTTKTYGAGKTIWKEKTGVYPIGGTIDVSSLSEGTVIPAGSMCILSQTAHTITIVAASDSANLANVNGLLAEDVVVDALAKSTSGKATGSVVYAGVIYASRVAEAIPSTVLAKLPQITAIVEA